MSHVEIHLTPSQMLAPRMQRYEERTGRIDGLDIIRDTLAKYGAARFRDLPGETQLKCVSEIINIFDNGS